MNPAILAYTPLPGQLPPAIAAQLRAAIPYGRRMRLASEGAAASASLLGIALARVLLGELQRQPPASIALQFPYRKKPFSPGGADFSLSHSGTWLAGIACASASVGLDIEEAAPLNPTAATVNRDLADWTAREAAVKFWSATLEQIYEVQVHEAHCLYRQEHAYLTRPEVPEGLTAAVVSERPLALTVRYLNWESLITRVNAPEAKVACA